MWPLCLLWSRSGLYPAAQGQSKVTLTLSHRVIYTSIANAKTRLNSWGTDTTLSVIDTCIDFSN